MGTPRLSTNSARYSTSFASATTPLGLIFFTSGERGCAWEVLEKYHPISRKIVEAPGWKETYQDHVRRMAKSIEIDKFLDLCGKAEQCRVHYIRQKPSQGLHIIAGLSGTNMCHPVIFGCFNEIIDFGIDHLEYPLLCGFLVASKLLCRPEGNRPANRMLRSCCSEERFKLTAGQFKML